MNLHGKVWLNLVLMTFIPLGGPLLIGHSQTKHQPEVKDAKKEPPPTTGQAFMRDKLAHTHKILDALALEDFDKIAESAKMLRMISRAASWYVLDSDEYSRQSRNFQDQATDLERHAKEKNLDATTLDYLRLSMTCVNCHKHVRQIRKKEKPR